MLHLALERVRFAHQPPAVIPGSVRRNLLLPFAF